LIVDDERLARERMRNFLREESSVEIIGECGSGTEAAAAIRHQHPDVVFLDVNMPGGDGLQVVAELPGPARPEIIFVTAHDSFALEAFGVQAVDYVLKPFDRERLRLALSRASEKIRIQRAAALNLRPANPLPAEPEPRTERLAFKADGRVVFLKSSDIVWVEAANNYSILHLAGAADLTLRETLSALETRLGAVNFARVNRSALVHVDQIQELQPAQYGDYTVLLRNGQSLPLSRNLRGRLEKFMSDGF
jgi:two-component system LytT family response regulator